MYPRDGRDSILAIFYLKFLIKNDKITLMSEKFAYI